MEREKDYKYQLVDALMDLARKDAYIALLERAVDAAREQRERDFLLLLPELDFRRVALYDVQEP